eukprot:2290783-Pleurochrysis_carterae.AAC.1
MDALQPKKQPLAGALRCRTTCREQNRARAHISRSATTNDGNGNTLQTLRQVCSSVRKMWLSSAAVVTTCDAKCGDERTGSTQWRRTHHPAIVASRTGPARAARNDIRFTLTACQTEGQNACGGDKQRKYHELSTLAEDEAAD